MGWEIFVFIREKVIVFQKEFFFFFFFTVLALVAVQAFLVVASGGYSQLQAFLIAVASLVSEHRL